MMKKIISFPKRQRGVVWWIVAATIAAIVAAVVGSYFTPTVAEQPPGCVPAGTQCRVFVQREVFCCGSNQVVGKTTGVCLGWYDALPCNPLGPNQ